MTFAVRFKVSEEGVTNLLLSDMVLDACMKVGQEVVEAAQATAPATPSYDQSAVSYADSITAIPRRSDKRAWVRVQSDLPYAMKIQADTGHLMSSLDAVRK